MKPSEKINAAAHHLKISQPKNADYSQAHDDLVYTIGAILDYLDTQAKNDAEVDRILMEGLGKPIV